MPLPKLETPTFKMKIPSTGKEVTFRPFLVKEEKLLLMLGDESPAEEKIQLVRNLISACIEDEIDFNGLTSFDIEFMFLRLRSKSVGQDVSVGMSCSKCESKNVVILDLDEDIFVDNLPTNTKKAKEKCNIKLSDSVGLTLRYPSFVEIGEGSKNTDKEAEMLNIITLCIDSVFDDKTVYKLSDYTEKEVNEFIQSLSMKNLEQIKKFFDESPKVKCKVDFVCNSCKEENKIVVEGMSNFF